MRGGSWECACLAGGTGSVWDGSSCVTECPHAQVDIGSAGGPRPNLEVLGGMLAQAAGAAAACPGKPWGPPPAPGTHRDPARALLQLPCQALGRLGTPHQATPSCLMVPTLTRHAEAREPLISDTHCSLLSCGSSCLSRCWTSRSGRCQVPDWPAPEGGPCLLFTALFLVLSAWECPVSIFRWLF